MTETNTDIERAMQLLAQQRASHRRDGPPDAATRRNRPQHRGKIPGVVAAGIAWLTESLTTILA